MEILKVPLSVAAGAAGVNQRIPSGAADGEGRDFVQRQRFGGGPHGLGKAHNFFHRLALHVQGDQQGGNLRVGGASGEDFGHDGASFFARERFVSIGNALQGVGDHGTGYKSSIPSCG